MQPQQQPQRNSSGNHRRMFRGRAGPTDGRLPKYDAARRRRGRRAAGLVRRVAAAHQVENSDSSEGGGRLYHRWQAAPPPLEDDDWRFFSTGEDASGETESEAGGDEKEQQEEEDTLSSEAAVNLIIRKADNVVIHEHYEYDGGDDDTENVQKADDDEGAGSAAAAADTTGKNGIRDADDSAAALRKEMAHLRQRAANVQSAFSSITMADPATYQTNVLNAVLNCVAEWRHILRHHDKACTTADKRRGGQWTYELVQASLQCGPLAGGKPAYMKRCGTAVARQVYSYLCAMERQQEGLSTTQPQSAPVPLPADQSTADETPTCDKNSLHYPSPPPQAHSFASTANKNSNAPPPPLTESLGWTEKQADAFGTWKRKALAAATAATTGGGAIEPSKSVASNQTDALRKKQQKQAKRAAKKKQLGL